MKIAKGIFIRKLGVRSPSLTPPGTGITLPRTPAYGVSLQVATNHYPVVAASSSIRIGIHRPVVDDDAVTLVPAQEDDVTQAVRRQCLVIFRI